MATQIATASQREEGLAVGEKRRHRYAIRLARKLVEIVSPCLRPEERGDAFREFYGVIDEGLTHFETKFRPKPPGPSRN